MAKERILIPSANDDEGGSGWGISYWTSWLKCPRKFYLNQLHNSNTEGTAVGTLFHKLLEIYYQRQHDDFVLEYAEGDEDKAWKEALRLFAAYRDLYPPTELGKVLGAEVPLEAKNPEEDYGGVPKLTGKVDMLIELDEDAVEQLMDTRPHLGWMEPGFYLVDHKTSKSRSSTLREEVTHSFQFTLYQLLYEEAYGERPAGLIANYVFKHVNLDPGKSFRSYYVPFPDEEKKETLNATLSKCAERYRNYRGTSGSSERTERDPSSPPPANPVWCFNYGACAHLRVFGGSCGQK